MGVLSTDPLLYALLAVVVGVAISVAAALFGVRIHARAKAGPQTQRGEAVKPQVESATEVRLREIAQMTGGLAHEIKNPLSTIGLNTRLLSEMIDDLDLPADEASRLGRRADALSREVERLEGILTDFLEYAGELRLDVQETDLNTLVRDVTDFFSPQAEQRGIRLRVQLAERELLARVDPGQLKQAVLNLMLNAVQAMEAEPQIDRANGGGELIVRTAGGGETAVIHVTDTGPGMEAKTLSRVFEPYFTTKAGGSGLGLPITRKLIEAMGGKFELHSEPGLGTDVTLAFASTPPAS